jgi:DNA-binding transcriptional MerR regulator/methylmalonyl-CoA mutase cobalamin-binding subunit
MSTQPGSHHHGAMLAIGAVVAELTRVYPDVSHSSLRFLEREGLIATTRTPGGHRLYTRDDVDRILQIKRWQGERLSLDEIRRRLASLDALPSTAALSTTFLEQALASDLAAARRTVLAADEVGMPLARLFGEVLQPALFEVGRRWGEGALLVSQEKEISELAREVIVELSLRHAPVTPGGPVVVAACVEGERHELGLRMIAGLLRAEGSLVHFLGADVAPRFLLEAVRLHRPAAVLLSAKLEPNLPAIRDAIAVLRGGLAADELPLILVGGQVAAEHAGTIEGWDARPIAGEHLEETVERIRERLGER